MAGSPAPSRPALPPTGGLIGAFVRHPTAANLLMVAMLALGVFSMQRLNTQFFPTIDVPIITVSVAWPGASAEDVEANILDALEPEVRFIDDVEEVISVAREGGATVTLEFSTNADMQKGLSDVEQAVAGITTFPQDSEEPVIRRVSVFETVAKVMVYGDLDEASLKAQAKAVRDRFLAAGIDRVTLTGTREEEIWIQIREHDLRRLGLSLSDVAARVREGTRDLPSGVIEGAVDVQLRALAERRTAETIGDIPIRALPNGETIVLRDVADVSAAFDRDGKSGFHLGRRAIELEVQRALTADTLQTMRVFETTFDALKTELPTGVTIESYDIRGKLVQDRLNILIENGIGGLVVVLAVLFLFLNVKIAFWVAAGIPVAMLATLFVMLLTGQTINMVSMFALIMMLGIVVDDAIVVGEHTATRQEMGDPPLVASERGAIEMLRPVLAVTLTTQAAFLPIYLIQGRIGDIMSAIPLVVTAVLIASLIECFLILPAHLRHSAVGANSRQSGFRRAFDRNFNRFRDGPFSRFVGLTYDWRYTTVASMTTILLVCFGLLFGGRVGFTFFPAPEPENMTATVVFGAGTPRDVQIAALKQVEDALARAEAELSQGREKLIKSSFILLGQAGRGQGDNLAQIDVQLAPAEERTILTRDISRAWRRALPSIPGVERIALVEQRGGPPGRDVDVRLQNAPVERLKAAADELKAIIETYQGVSAVADDLPYGKPELVLEVTPRGAALGFTTESVGTQLRNAFEGAIATRFARGEEEITVRVMRTQELGGAAALARLYLVSPSGQDVALTEVVTIREKAGFSVIQRNDGVRQVAVTGDIDADVTSVQEVVARLQGEVMPALAAKYDLTYAFKGRAEEQSDAFRDLRLGAYLALVMIYLVLAWVFENYFKPLAVLTIVPFGLAGAIFGHYWMGFDLTIISLVGLLGLSGILVNDSIVLIAALGERLRGAVDLREAAIGAARDRLRAVLLTSLTTIGGLAPLLFETSRQAQFLLPMAITLVFGLLFATVLVLILVPSVVGIGGDIGRLAKRIVRPFRKVEPAE